MEVIPVSFPLIELPAGMATTLHFFITPDVKLFTRSAEALRIAFADVEAYQKVRASVEGAS